MEPFLYSVEQSDCMLNPKKVIQVLLAKLVNFSTLDISMQMAKFLSCYLIHTARGVARIYDLVGQMTNHTLLLTTPIFSHTKQLYFHGGKCPSCL